MFYGFRETLRRWGLRASKNLLNLIERAVRGRWSTSQFLDHLRQTPEYRERFVGLQWKTGMTEGQYLAEYAQFKARAQDVGMQLSRQDFAKVLKRGVSFEEFSARVDALGAIEQYGPMWKQFEFELQQVGELGENERLTKKGIADLIMGVGSKKWETIWQRAYITTALEKVAGIDVVEKAKGEAASPDGYELSRNNLLSIIKSVEALSPGFDIESLKGMDFAEIGKNIRSFDLRYLRRYGLEVKDILSMQLGGPNAAKLAARAERVKATQEAFFEPRAQEDFLAAAAQQAEELPQSR